MSVTWFVPRSDLSPDQLRAVELPVREHTLVLGAPGSGKTLVLLHRAKRLIAEEGMSPDRLRIFVFTNTLKDYIRSTLGVLDIPESCVLTFDYWCREFYTTFISRRVPFANHAPDFDAIRAAVLDKLRGGAPLATLASSRDPQEQNLLGDEENRPSPSPQNATSRSSAHTGAVLTSPPWPLHSSPTYPSAKPSSIKPRPPSARN